MHSDRNLGNKKSSTHMSGAFLLFLCLFSPISQAEIGLWMTTETFLEEAFTDTPYSPQIVWITPELRSNLESALDRNFPGIRIRYWGNGSRKAWILEQIGKERIITAGFVTQDTQIIDSYVLEYRESRGGEVRYNSFLQQFEGLALNGRQKLDGHIDGITGATMSVRSMRQMATAALILHEQAATEI
tara:strand:- start:156 stop:716 length:561 start_codon:yes stop_codon:yes gene_type:complete